MKKDIVSKLCMLTLALMQLCMCLHAQITINRNDPDNPVLTIKPLKPEIERFTPFVNRRRDSSLRSE